MLIRGEAIGKLADVAIGAVKRSGDPRMTPEKEKSVREWMAAVPLFIAVAQKIAHDNTKIPEQEQLLATGAAAMNLLNAVHMLGYGAFWSTGMGTYVEDVQNALGLDSLDYRFLGYLAVGTPAARCRRRRVRTSVNSSRSGTVPSDRTPRASADATRAIRQDPAQAGFSCPPDSQRQACARRTANAGAAARGKARQGPRRQTRRRTASALKARRRPLARVTLAGGHALQSRAMASDGKARDYPLGPCLVKKNAHDTIKRGDNL